MRDEPKKLLTLERVDLGVLEDLDFDAELPCERPGCVVDGGPGFLYVRNLPCPKCGDTSIGDFVCCKACWDHAWVRGLFCMECKHRMARDEAWALLRYVK